MRNNYLAIGSSIFFLAALTAFEQLDITRFEEGKLTGLVFIFFGLVTFITAFHKINRGTIFIGAVLLLTGIVLLVINNFEILNNYDVLLGSTLFVTGGGFLALYLDNPKEPVMFYFFSSCFILSVVVVFFQEKFGLIDYANRLTIALFDFWPLFLILFGIIFLTGKKK